MSDLPEVTDDIEFRIVNQRQNEVIELRGKVVFSQREVRNGRAVRRFYDLSLERDRVTYGVHGVERMESAGQAA